MENQKEVEATLPTGHVSEAEQAVNEKHDGVEYANATQEVPVLASEKVSTDIRGEA